MIFEPQHKNIATLIAFLATIFLGIGAGWLVGSVFSSAPGPEPVIEQAQPAVEPDQVATASLSSVNSSEEAKELSPVEQSATDEPLIIKSDTDEPRASAQRRGSSRRAYVTARAGEPIPIAVIKGKPIKKAFKQIKRVRIW